MPSVTSSVSEWPMATREELWRAYRPATEFSDAKFQGLRRDHLVSEGVAVTSRAHGRFAGQERIFSRLNILALNAERDGDKDAAKRLVEAASSLESRDAFRRVIRMFMAMKDASASTAMDRLASRPAPQQVRSFHPETLMFRLTVAAENPPDWSDLVDLCQKTDSYHFLVQIKRTTRLAARVRKITDDVADLSVGNAGFHVWWDRIKLENIGCAFEGANVMIYKTDLGGTDELIRARPALDLALLGACPADDSPTDYSGMFTRRPQNVTGDDAQKINDFFRQKHERPQALTGLRFVE